MTAPRYPLDDRTVDGVLAAVRAIAARQVVPSLPPPGSGEPAEPTWADLLFAGDRLATGEPSAALLDALVRVYPRLLEHLNTLPDRALVDWLERRLGIPRLPVVPDHAVVVPTPDPKKLPVVVRAGTALRGGKDAAGNERRYVTQETLSVLGAELVDVRSYRTAPDPEGESCAAWADRDTPFEPFPPGAIVPHLLDIVTPVIAFDGGSLSVRLRFQNASRAIPKNLVWEHTTADGLRSATVTAQTGEVVDLQLDGSCAALTGDPDGLPFVRVSLPPPPHAPSAFDLRFDTVTAEVVVRSGVKPDAGFYNDGVVDITKEFQPFGPVAKRGDSFYIRSDEAFGKPLSSLSVHLDLLGDNQMYPVAWGGGIPQYLVMAYKEAYGEATQTGKDKFTAYFIGGTKDTGDARVAWQRYVGSAWSEFSHTDDALKTIDATGLSPVHDVHSEPFEVAGVRGRMIRAFLDRGDFGWVAYQDRIANFAAEAAKKTGTPSASDLKAPDPPIVSTITLAYTTQPVRATRLRSRNGWSSRDLAAGDLLFSLPLIRSAETDAAGELAFGLGLPASALGVTVSLYIDIEPAAACTTSDAVPLVAWESWSATDRWLPLDGVDGTAGLRQAGLLRFVAPMDWPDGSSDVSATTGRWIRARTNLPDRLGTIRAVVPDAVTAVYESQLPEPARDPTPDQALKAKELKGLTVPIDGIKKFTNPLPGTAGRGPEPDERYVARAASWTRHRNRAIQAWDYEAIVTAEFPEVATVRCLPHTGVDDEIRPGSVGLVIVPWSHEPKPYPSVTLAERIVESLRGRLPVHARPIVLCPIYVDVSVDAHAVLRPGVSASDAKRSLRAAIDDYLHPAENAPFGRELFASTIVRFLESRPEIDHVTDFALIADPCPPGVPSDPCRVERVTVDPCRGLVASSGSHALELEEQL